MPVLTTGSAVQYTGDGVRTTFPFTFPIGSEGDLVVKVRVTATGVTVTQTLTTHYTVTKSGTNFDNGGNVEMVSAPAATDTLIITRDTTQTQSTDLIYGDPHDSEAYENMVDRNTLMIQELQKQIDRCFKIPDSDPDTADMETANSVDRASQYSGFDANGNLIAAATFAAYGAASAFMQTVLDAANALAARTTLGTRQIKIGNSSRSTGGDEIITGVGFKPSLIMFMAKDTTSANQNWSIGLDTLTEQCEMSRTTNGTLILQSVSRSIFIQRDGPNNLSGVVSAIGSDGFTITWTLGGTLPLSYVYLCLP